MSAPVLFLLGAFSLSMLGAMVVWLASRPRKERFGSTIDTFSRDLDALAPPGSNPSPRPIHNPGTRPNSTTSGAEPRPRPGPRPDPSRTGSR